MINRQKRPMSARLHSGAFEFAYLGEDLCEPVGEPVKALAIGVVWERAAEDLQRVLGGLEGIDETVEAGAELRRRGLGCGARCLGLERAIWNSRSRSVRATLT